MGGSESKAEHRRSSRAGRERVFMDVGEGSPIRWKGLDDDAPPGWATVDISHEEARELQAAEQFSRVSERRNSFESIASAEAEVVASPWTPPTSTRPNFDVEDFLEEMGSLRQDNPDSLCLKHYDESYCNGLSRGDRVGFLMCIQAGVQHPDADIGCYAMRASDYDKFAPFFAKVIADYHRAPEGTMHTSSWSLDSVAALTTSGALDLAEHGIPPVPMCARVRRNLQGFPLPGAMKRAGRVALEARLSGAMDALKANPAFGGCYYSSTPGHKDAASESDLNQLVADGLMFDNLGADKNLAAAGIAGDWPHGRGCYVSANEQVVIWVGGEDHLQIMCSKTGSILNEVFNTVKGVLDIVSAADGVEFATSETFGFVASSPTNVGTGFEFSVEMALPNLTVDGTTHTANQTCEPVGVSARGAGGTYASVGAGGKCLVTNSAQFGVTEAEIVVRLYKGLQLLKDQDDASELM